MKITKLLKKLTGKHYSVIGFIVLIIMAFILPTGNDFTGIDIAEVLIGDFIVDVEVSGTISAHQSRYIRGFIQLGRTIKIAELVPEGKVVKKGDFLIRFDTSEIEKLQRDAEANLRVRNQELILLLTQYETDSVRLSRQLKIAGLEFEKTKMKYEMSYLEPENKQRQMQISMKNAEMTFQNKTDQIQGELLDSRGLVQQKRIEIRNIENEINVLHDLVGRATIYAPIPGLVVYREISSGMGGREKIRVGTSTTYSRILMELPDLSLMRIKAEVNEVEYADIKLGQEVKIDLDISEMSYTGIVTDIATLARMSYFFLPGEPPSTKTIFDITIEIQKDEDDLTIKPGMKAVSKIITNKLRNATYIPVRAVFEEAGVTYVYVKDGSSFRKTPVTVGIGNKKDVVITEGLTPGQQVALSDPFAEESGIAQIGSK